MTERKFTRPADGPKPCPFCGSKNIKHGGDDKVVGSWCLNCGATGPNLYLTINGDFDWDTRADVKVTYAEGEGL